MAYEKVGFISPLRTSTKRRMYSSDDLDKIQFLKFLTKDKKINLAGVKFLLEAMHYTQGREIDLKNVLFSDFKLRSLL